VILGLAGVLFVVSGIVILWRARRGRLGGKGRGGGSYEMVDQGAA
jgi:hypothetical protein